MEFSISPILTGAPEAPRCAVETAAFALLDRLGISYTRVEHPPADTAEVRAAVNRALDIRICKNLFLCNRQQTDFYLLCMPEDKPFRTSEVSRQIGSSRLSFAPPEQMEALLGCTPGSASVLGLMCDTEHRVRLLLDREVAESEWFGCHPCKNDGSLKLRTRDILEVFLPSTGHAPAVVDLSGE